MGISAHRAGRSPGVLSHEVQREALRKEMVKNRRVDHRVQKGARRERAQLPQ